MTEISKTFNSLTVQRSELESLFNEVRKIARVKVGKRLEVSLLGFEEYNEKSQTLFGYSITWVEGTAITVEAQPTRKKFTEYKTVNYIPQDYEVLQEVVVKLTSKGKKRITLVEAAGLAARKMLEDLKDEDNA